MVWRLRVHMYIQDRKQLLISVQEGAAGHSAPHTPVRTRKLMKIDDMRHGSAYRGFVKSFEFLLCAIQLASHKPNDGIQNTNQTVLSCPAALEVEWCEFHNVYLHHGVLDLNLLLRAPLWQCRLQIVDSGDGPGRERILHVALGRWSQVICH